MNTILRKLLVENWKRKTFASLLAVFIWLMVNQSLTSTRTLFNVPVRVVNIPPTKTIEGIHTNGRINKKITLTLQGNKQMLDSLQPQDIEVVIDASHKPDEWLATISKKNLISLNPDVDLSNAVTKVSHPNFLVHLSKLVTEKIPIAVTTPIGEAPRGYQLLDVWPYYLELTISGPEEQIRKLRNKEIKLTFNLADFPKKKLDELAKEEGSDACSVVSCPIPDMLKYVHIPLLSDSPILINDPNAQSLRIDFIRNDLMPINNLIPVQFIYQPGKVSEFNPQNIHIKSNSLIRNHNGIHYLDAELSAKGSDRAFLNLVKNHLFISVVVGDDSPLHHLKWCVQFLNAHELENRYVEMHSTEDEDVRFIQHSRYEEYLRNRFRSYMHHFRLYLPNGNKLNLQFDLKDHQLTAHIDDPSLLPDTSHPITTEIDDHVKS